jgi:hypothetical protein
MRNNTPGILASPVAPARYVPIPSSAQQRIATRQAINLLTTNNRETCNLAFTPTALLLSVVEQNPLHFEHFTFPMVHPITGETILSYKKLMHDPATANTWQTAFGKNFGGMAQGNNKMGQKGTNAIFVMTHDEIRHVLLEGKKFTYGNPVVDTARKKTIRIVYKSRRGAILSHTNPALPSAQLTLVQLNCIGIASSAQKGQNTCASASRIFI